MPIFKNYTRIKIISQILFWAGSIIFAMAAFYVASDHKLSPNLPLFLRAVVPNIGFALAVYVNLYWLIPRFLKNKNYIFYSFGLSVTLSVSALLIQLLFIYGFRIEKFSNEFGRLFSSYFFSSAFYVGITSLFKFVKDWLELQETEKKLSHIEKEKLEAELNSLKAQINPHFLFNSLNNIYSLALINSEKTPHLILMLSELMRHVLYESRENYIPVRKEIEFSRNFVELQRIRLSEKTDVQFAVKGTIPDLKIIPLVFEPFIDNAFKHGLKNPTENPFIRITFEFCKNWVHFSVKNNYKELSSVPSTGNSSGIGQVNARKRLEYLYSPGEYRLEIMPDHQEYEVRLAIQLKD